MWIANPVGISDSYIPGIPHIIVGVIALIIVIIMATLLGNTLNKGPQPVINSVKSGRKTLSDYLTASRLPDSTPLSKFRVATANFGGIYTVQRPLDPYSGWTCPEAVRDQVEAGARAIVFDIWPDPADNTTPIIAIMRDEDSDWYKWWKNTGSMTKGVGSYSNWAILTRNKGNVKDIMTAAVNTAFSISEDPFFIIINLHGAMTVDYLNTLGTNVSDAIGGRRLASEWHQGLNSTKFSTTPISAFMSKTIVIVNPDVQPTFDALPGIRTLDQFNVKLKTTSMGELANVIATTQRPVVAEPSNIDILTTQNQMNCSTSVSDPQQSIAETGLCVIQPTIGSSSVTNDDLFVPNNFDLCMASGAQFVAVNLFSADSVSALFFEPKYFGLHSFLAVV